jgi:Ca-activated chloride channel family protein
MASGRDKARRTVDTYFASGSTALYRSIAEANRFLLEQATPDRISAIVVLSDGADTEGNPTLEELLEQIGFDAERESVRVFTIGYDTQPEDEAALEEIAEATKAKFFEGTPENIREVFRDISTFF